MPDREKLLKEKARLNDILASIESSYRNAKISEKSYNELKEKALKKIGEIEIRLNAKKDNGEQNKKNLASAQADNKKDDKMPKDKPKGSGEDPAGNFTDEAAQVFGPQVEVEEPVSSEKPKTEVNLEIEKMKVLLDSMREERKVLQENLQNISENIGEIRSMAFQTEGLAKELEMKIEKLQDEVSDVRPDEIGKRLRKFEENVEKFQIYTEKADAKFEDLSKKINSVHEMLKNAGGIENLSEINRQIGKKLEDFNEAMKYVERLASKTEKAFLEMNKNLEEFHLYKARQDNVEDAFKDIAKSIDEIGIRIEGLTPRKDFESYLNDIMILKKQVEEASRIIPMMKIKLPEPIQKLSKERDEVNAMLDVLEEQVKNGTISVGEYEKLKKANEKKLKFVEDALESEWKKIEKIIESGGDIESLNYQAPAQEENAEAPQSNQPVAEPSQSQVASEEEPVKDSDNVEAEDKQKDIQTTAEAGEASAEGSADKDAVKQSEETYPESLQDEKSSIEQPTEIAGAEQYNEEQVPVKRKRGRPRKNPPQQQIPTAPSPADLLKEQYEKLRAENQKMMEANENKMKEMQEAMAKQMEVFAKKIAEELAKTKTAEQQFPVKPASAESPQAKEATKTPKEAPTKAEIKVPPVPTVNPPSALPRTNFSSAEELEKELDNAISEEGSGFSASGKYSKEDILRVLDSMEMESRDNSRRAAIMRLKELMLSDGEKSNIPVAEKIRPGKEDEKKKGKVFITAESIKRMML